MTNDPTRTMMREELIASFGDVDEFALEEAIYWFAADYHGGQSSSLYRALSVSPYKPGAMTHAPEEPQLYDHLVDTFA